ncbi:DEAD/DEAH box helicase [Pseudoroseicyclus sp. H15]
MINTLSEALAERGYDTLTPVQEAVSDSDLNDSDLLVSAQTGSGKTVAFGLAIGPTLLEDDGRMPAASAPMALIVAPTRELAFQVKRELDWLYGKTGAQIASCVGGMDARAERRALERGPQIVVGTPGRLRDHIERGALVLSELKAVVLDEADEMLDLGFREDLEFMLSQSPQGRRTLLFSATLPPQIEALAKTYQRDAKRLSTLTGTRQHADIEYQVLEVAQQDAERAVINVLRYHDAETAIVFANTRAMVARLTARLANRGFLVVSLSGELSQTERSHALQAMRDGRAKVCVATDVAARGIDLPNLTLVVHAELPSNAEGILHRSGRTGRAGRKGISALIVPKKIAKKAERLLKTAKVTAEWKYPPSADDILRRDEERLLNDPAFNEEIGEDEAAFAEKLLARHSPEQVVAAYLRLYREHHSAPEELMDADAPAPRKERAPFGPSRWISLSVGREERAEARWLLPLLLRVGGLDKQAIGAIRVQDKETFVELTEAAAPGFLASLGADGKLEDGVIVTALDGAPEFGRPAPRDSRAPHGKPADRKPRAEAPRPRAEPEAPRAAEAAPAYDPANAQPKEKKPRHKAEPRRDAPPAQVERKPRDGGKPAGKPGGKPYGKSGAKPGAKPFGKPGGKRDEKPGVTPMGKSGGKNFGKPLGKAGGKPGGKPAGKPGAAPRGRAAAYGDATDSSKRFVPPGKADGTRKGGAQPPRRKKD